MKWQVLAKNLLSPENGGWGTGSAGQWEDCRLGLTGNNELNILSPVHVEAKASP